MVKHAIIWYGISHTEFRSVALLMSFLHLLPILNLLAFVMGENQWDSLDTMPALLSNSQYIGALCISAILATNAKHISVWAAVGKGNSIPTRAGTQIPNVIQRANTFLRWRSVTETEPPTQKTIIPSKLVIAILSRSKAGLSQFHNSSMEFSSWAESTSPFLWSSFKFFLPSSCDSVDTFHIYFLKKSFLISVN